MDDHANDASVPSGWIETLKISEAQIAAGQTSPLEPVLERLRVRAEEIAARTREKATHRA